MNLHDKIMNIPTDTAGSWYSVDQMGYKDGHRDARHVASEMAIKYDSFVDEVERMMKTIISMQAGSFSSDEGSSDELNIIADLAEEMLDSIKEIKR